MLEIGIDISPRNGYKNKPRSPAKKDHFFFFSNSFFSYCKFKFDYNWLNQAQLFFEACCIFSSYLSQRVRVGEFNELYMCERYQNRRKITRVKTMSNQLRELEKVREKERLKQNSYLICSTR